jgi:hypothetical protein
MRYLNAHSEGGRRGLPGASELSSSASRLAISAEGDAEAVKLMRAPGTERRARTMSGRSFGSVRTQKLLRKQGGNKL